MKTRLQKLLAAFAALVWLSTINLTTAFAQGTAFTYQGQLQNAGALASGSFNLTFTLFNTNTSGTAIAGPVTNGVIVSNGLFTVTIDFGGAVWNGETNWLEIAVETNGSSPFTTLSPRQRVTPTPYAITAGNLNSSGLSGTYGSMVTLNNPANQFAGGFIGDGTALTNVDAATLGGVSASNFWQLGGNTVAGGSQIAGTLNGQPFDLYAGGVRALRLILRTDAGGIYTNAPNLIGGSSINLVKSGVVGGTVGGGGGNITNGISFPNQVNADFGTISGGSSNDVTDLGTNAFIGGGFGNIAGGFAATVGGGELNTATNENATVAGGFGNSAGVFATVGGGDGNSATANVSTVPGGANNTASGVASFAAGVNAMATGDGSFVWSDNTGTITSDTGDDQFVARASGGFFFYTGSGSSGAKLAGGATSWTVLCDRNAKKNFQPVDTVAVLNKLAAIPIEQWNYKWEGDSDTPNIGPMAQDFKAAFYPGRDDKGISTLEFDGVELAAIQGLNQKLEAGDEKSEAGIQKAERQIDELKAENAELKARLEKLEQRLGH